LTLFIATSRIEEITIPDTVTVINNGAFRNAVNLKKVNLSSSLTKIGDSAFNGCSQISNLKMPDKDEPNYEVLKKIFDLAERTPIY
jgi:hypothetical protein